MISLTDFRLLADNFQKAATRAVGLANTEILQSLSQTIFTPGQIKALEAAATPSLVHAFIKAGQMSDTEAVQKLVRRNIAHSFQDPVLKRGVTLAYLTEQSAGESDLHQLNDKSRGYLAAMTGGLPVMVRDIAANYRMLLPERSAECDALLARYEDEFAPRFSAYAAAWNIVEADVYTKSITGTEHLRRLPSHFPSL